MFLGVSWREEPGCGLLAAIRLPNGAVMPVVDMPTPRSAAGGRGRRAAGSHQFAAVATVTITGRLRMASHPSARCRFRVDLSRGPGCHAPYPHLGRGSRDFLSMTGEA